MLIPMRSSAARRRWIAGSLLLAGAAFALARRRQGRGSGYRFDDDYRELLRLGDGTYARLRTIRSTDRALLASEMRRASSETRYQRFHAARSDLSAAELRYLTEVDGDGRFELDGTEIVRRVAGEPPQVVPQPGVGLRRGQPGHQIVT